MRLQSYMRRGSAPSHRKGAEERIKLGLYALKPAFQRLLSKAADALVQRAVHPDLITVSAVGVSALVGAALICSPANSWLLLAVPPLALVRTALNALDGMVARRRGLNSPRGEIMNELCDRLSDTVIFVSLALTAGICIAIGLAAVVAVLMASHVGVLAKAAGASRQYVGVMGKPDRMLWLSVAALCSFVFGIGFMNYLLVAVLAGSVVTAVHRLAAAVRELPPNLGATSK